MPKMNEPGRLFIPRFGQPISSTSSRSGLKNREVQILVNSVRVCEPISLNWDLLPASSQLNVHRPDSATRFRVEYDRIEVRELAP